MSKPNPFEMFFRTSIIEMIKAAQKQATTPEQHAKFFDGLFVALAGNVGRLIAINDETKRTLMLGVIAAKVDEEVARHAAELAIKTAAAIDKKE